MKHSHHVIVLAVRIYLLEAHRFAEWTFIVHVFRRIHTQYDPTWPPNHPFNFYIQKSLLTKASNEMECLISRTFRRAAIDATNALHVLHQMHLVVVGAGSHNQLLKLGPDRTLHSQKHWILSGRTVIQTEERISYFHEITSSSKLDKSWSKWIL